jgi:hypothetical protein
MPAKGPGVDRIGRLLVLIACAGCAQAEDPSRPSAEDGAAEPAAEAAEESPDEEDGPPDGPDAAEGADVPDWAEAADGWDSADDGAEAPEAVDREEAVDRADGEDAPELDDGPDDGPSEEVCGTTVCGPSETCCSGSCVDTDTDTRNCGGCGAACDRDRSDRCVAGTCRCETETACEGGSWIACCAPDGCVDTDYNDRHCGGCGRACFPGSTCSFGTCWSSGP